MYTVVKRHACINGNVYCQGEKVELSEKAALHLISQGVVIPTVSTILPSDSDGLFAELNAEIVTLKETIEKQKEEIARMGSELELKGKVIAELDAKKSRR